MVESSSRQRVVMINGGDQQTHSQTDDKHDWQQTDTVDRHFWLLQCLLNV